MDLVDLKDYFIPGCFQDRGWDKLLGDLPRVCEPLIREFYANVIYERMKSIVGLEAMISTLNWRILMMFLALRI